LISNAGKPGSFTIVFKPGAQFSILNSSPVPTTSSDFRAYYLMGTGSGGCTKVPSDGVPCAPQTAECVISKAPVKSAKTAALGSPTATPGRKLKPRRLENDIDCANSHWP
jgi:hypothetical protein